MEKRPVTSNALAYWFASVLVAPFVGTLLFDAVGGWLLVYAALVVLILFVFPGGWLSREGYGPSPAGRACAYLLLVVAVALAPLAAERDPLLGSIVTVLFSLAAALLMWRSLRSRLPLMRCLLGVVFMSLGTLLAKVGRDVWWSDETVFSRVLVIVGLSFLVIGLAILSAGNLAFTAVFVLGGLAIVLLGAAVRTEQSIWLLISELVVGVAAVLLGAARFIGSSTLFAIAAQFLGLAMIAAGGVAVTIVSQAIAGDPVDRFGRVMLGVMLACSGTGFVALATSVRREGLRVLQRDICQVNGLFWTLTPALLVGGCGFAALAAVTFRAGFPLAGVAALLLAAVALTQGTWLLVERVQWAHPGALTRWAKRMIQPDPPDAAQRPPQV